MPKSTTEKKQRTVKKREYKSFRLSKRIPSTAPPLLAARKILIRSLKLLWSNKKLFLGVLAVFGILQLLLVRGILAIDFASLIGLGSETGLLGGLTLLTYFFGASGEQISAEGSVYQTVLTLIVSLALIWALRHVVAGARVSIRDTYYKGMYPLVPFILVFVVLLLQLIPMLMGSWLYYTMISAGVATGAVENVFWIIISILFALPTFYWITNSMIALYVVTLPEMTPIKALRSARELVKNRRAAIFFRIVALVFAVFLLLAVAVVPVIMVVPALSAWVFYIMGVVSVAVVHSYMYVLYRELL